MRQIRSNAGSPRGFSILLRSGREIPLAAAGPGAELLLSLLTFVLVLALSLLAATAFALAVYVVCGIELLRLVPRLSLLWAPAR